MSNHSSSSNKSGGGSSTSASHQSAASAQSGSASSAGSSTGSSTAVSGSKHSSAAGSSSSKAASKSASGASGSSAGGSSSTGGSSSSANGSSSAASSSKGSSASGSNSSSTGASSASSTSKGSRKSSTLPSKAGSSSKMHSKSKTSTGTSKSHHLSKTSPGGSKGAASAAASAKEEQVTTACTMNVPNKAGDVKDLAKTKGAKKVSSMADIEAAGFKMKDIIIVSGMDEFYGASCSKEQKAILAKKCDIKKCSGRYKANLLSTALRVLRYMGGADEAGTLKSPNFTKIYEIFQLNSDIITFMEHITGQSLFNRIVGKEATTAVQHRKWTVQLLQAIHKMQDVGVAHRQITVHQVLFNEADQVKLVGWSKAVIYWDPTEGGHALLQKPERRAQANSHLPPDCFRRNAYDPSKVDIWSVGVLMVAMETGRLPFNVSAPFKLSAQWRQFVTVHEMNRFLRIACNQVFWIDPKRRATVDDLLKSPYFTAAEGKISEKALKKTVDPKHHPELFEGADPSVTMSKLGCNAPSSSGSSASGSSKAQSKTALHSSSAGGGSAVAPKASKSSTAAGSSKGSSASASRSASSSGSSASGNGSSSSAGSSSGTSSASGSAGGSSSSADSSGGTEEGSDAATGNEGGSVAESASKSESQATINSSKEESAEYSKPVSVSHKSMLSAKSSHSSAASGSHHSSSAGSRSGSKTSSSSSH